MPYAISGARPIVSPIEKSGAYGGNDPHAGFRRAFLEDPLVRLPSGTWEITATATFIDRAACEGESMTLTPTVRVRVTD